MEGKNQADETVIPAEVVRKAATGVTVYSGVACVNSLFRSLFILI
jgi:hypothetical protein